MHSYCYRILWRVDVVVLGLDVSNGTFVPTGEAGDEGGKGKGCRGDGERKKKETVEMRDGGEGGSEVQTDRQTDMQTGREGMRYRQTDMQTGREGVRYRQTDRQTCRHREREVRVGNTLSGWTSLGVPQSLTINPSQPHWPRIRSF